MYHVRTKPFIAAVLLIAAAKGGMAKRGAAMLSEEKNATAACTSDADCSDSRYCNGPEHCADGICVDGDAPCSGYECDEAGANCRVGACCIPEVGCFTPVGRFVCESVGGTYQGPNAGCVDQCHFGGSGDRNEDGQVDLTDVPSWVVCFSGPMPSALPHWCVELDLDGDTRIDLTDFSVFQRRFGRCATTEDEDHDGVGDACDACPATEIFANANSHGCSSFQLDSDADGVPDGADECPATQPGTPVNSIGCPGFSPSPVCGNGAVEEGEHCDPPMVGSCDTACQLIATELTIDADSCANPSALNAAGTFRFNNTTATTDGPGHTACVFSQEPQISHDIWACWTAPYTATVFVRTLDLTFVDTKIAVYADCACPTVANDPLACNDDLVTTGALQSLLAFEAVAGQQYMLRLGTYPGVAAFPTPGGHGAVTISCGVPNCPTTGSCNLGHSSPGCEDQNCCEKTCALDPYCCSTGWDNACVSEAAGICDGAFSACGRPRAADCAAPNGTGSPGCDDVDCCNAVCVRDPFCCLNQWDRSCAEAGAGICHTACGSLDAGECDTEHQTPGCKDSACCAELCPRDPFCCLVSWDTDCILLADQLCK